MKRSWVVGATLVLASVWSCSSESTNHSSDACNEGQVASCQHSSGCPATRVCGANSLFGLCQCADDAGLAGAAGLGAAGGSGGAGATSGSGGAAQGGGGASGGSGGSAASGGAGGAGAVAGSSGSGGQTVDASTGCNMACKPNEICKNGQCDCNCPNLVQGGPSCEGEGCVCASSHNMNTDPTNCGGCGAKCPDTWKCELGVCKKK